MTEATPDASDLEPEDASRGVFANWTDVIRSETSGIVSLLPLAALAIFLMIKSPGNDTINDRCSYIRD